MSEDAQQPYVGHGGFPVKPDLSLVPTDDLLEALEKRLDHMIFSGLMKEVKPGEDHEIGHWHGYSVMCQGLALALVRQIQDWERNPPE